MERVVVVVVVVVAAVLAATAVCGCIEGAQAAMPVTDLVVA